MTLEGFAAAILQHGRYRKVIVENLAFLMRYGHQPLDTLLRTPITFLFELSDEVQDIMRQEKEQWQTSLAGED